MVVALAAVLSCSSSDGAGGSGGDGGGSNGDGSATGGAGASGGSPGTGGRAGGGATASGGAAGGATGDAGGGGANGGGAGGQPAGEWHCFEAPDALCFCHISTTDTDPPRCTNPFPCCVQGSATSCECADEETCATLLASSPAAKTVATCPPP